MKQHLHWIAAVGLAISLSLRFFLPQRPQETLSERSYGKVIHETTSEFSRIRERDGVRNLFFIEDSGVEQRQSAIDLKARPA